MLSKDELPFCPVATTVDLIGNKWKLLIMRELLTGTKRFNEMHKAISGISQKVLTENLRKMEEDGIIDRKVYAVVPPKVEYSLSELGDSLRPIIDSMSDWGTAYIKDNLM
ncbi:helix-turn-helix transcriptional regulator [Enterococcus sp. PF-2]|jgi:DNA-binding HxlR family transcriptional regulator|uniref:winged helix-turn-helix transcriptional regulator n=1 Tax=Enterococcus TaxID=1350 RepID=UPI001122A406|nr:MULTISPECIES: helix-turn-helix domain-containing protein [unclassified Enterococcus]TPE08102.1 helix-turn-helix transcriptional regulator [Enterococcus sp. PF-3]TPE29193.1 helix-turn-helix transcriptional regulator [Enterococcus sp. PF-2]